MFAALIIVWLLSMGSALDFEKCKVLDLTHTVKQGIPHWGEHDFTQESLIRGKFLNAEYVDARMFQVPEHFATHADAPSHGFPKVDEFSIDDIPLEQFIGPACVFNLYTKMRENADASYGLTVGDILDWEKENGRMPVGCIALTYSGNEFNWDNPTKYLGLEGNEHDPFGSSSTYRGAGFSAEAAEFLVMERRVKGVGTDTLSIDVGNYQGAGVHIGAHKAVLGRNLPAYENLNNLHRMPARGATVAMLPMKLINGSGGPIRAMAVGWNGPNDPCRREEV